MRAYYELVSGNDQSDIARDVFGRDQSAQSQVMGWFMEHIYDTFSDLVMDNLDWWHDEGFMEQSRVAIRKKLASLGLILPDAQCRIAGFIDCNCMETCVPGSGPIGPGGAGQARWDDNIQRAFYNGWKSIHGLKSQTYDDAFGFTEDLYGSVSLRKNDLRLLGNSRLNRRLAALQNQFVVYGDSIYPQLTNVTSRGPHVQTMKTLRVSIEWNYAVTSHNLYRALSAFDKLRLLSSDRVAKLYTVATILRNCHVSMYGGQSMAFFDLRLPDNMLERYTRVV